jgi:CO/xanthine dehydrogenase FAD-binding subunit
MTTWKKYHLAQNVEDALRALTAARGESRLIAGGTDLLLDLQQGRHSPVDTLVDITQIAEMNLLEIRQQSLFIGAALPLNQIVRHPLVFEHAQALYEAAGLIGGPQVRNTATLGGNVGHALPAADGTIALLALEARAEIADPGGRRQAPLGELFLGPGRSALDPCEEILVGFYLPLIRPGQASAFRRIMRPQGVAIAILNMAIWVERRGERIGDVRIAVGPGGPVPQRAREAERALIGETPSEDVVQQALDNMLGETHFRTSPHRATEAYRRHMAGVLLKETLSVAWGRVQVC